MRNSECLTKDPQQYQKSVIFKNQNVSGLATLFNDEDNNNKNYFNLESYVQRMAEQ